MRWGRVATVGKHLRRFCAEGAVVERTGHVGDGR